MIRLVDAAERLAAMLPDSSQTGYYRYFARLEIEALRAELAAYKSALKNGKVTTTRNADGELVAVTLTDDEHRVLAVLWSKDGT